jgi:hypothetical protein
MSDAQPLRPMLRVVRGEPTPEELAALVAVLGARSAGGSRPPATRSAWSDPAGLVRRPLTHGRGQWTRSGRPG